MENYSEIPQQPFVQKYHIKGILITLVMLFLLIGSAMMTGVNVGMFLANLDQFVVILGQMANPSWDYLKVIWKPLYETMQMALVGTTIGTLIAIPFSLLAARNLVKNKIIRSVVRFILDIVRTFPDLLLGAIFVAIFGIGTTAGVVTLAIFSFGMVSKLFYEMIETIDMGPIEAMQAAGANSIQVIWFAVVPQITNQFISYFLYTLEINVRASTVLGYIGAGGIGVFLQRSLDQFAYADTAVIIIATFIVVLVIDFISNHLRRVLL